MNKPRKGPALGGGILSALQATSMVDSRSSLPAEILVAILDYLPVTDQLRFARASRRMREMVYDDTRWVSRLKSMGCWDELEARQRFEAAMRRKRELAAATEKANGSLQDTNPTKSKEKSTTLFDASVEEERRNRASSDLHDGFQTMSLQKQHHDPASDPTAYLDVFKRVRSIRGGARQEFGKIYGALAPFYLDLTRAKSHTDPVVFKAFRDPEKQAAMLSNLQRFAKSDWTAGCDGRRDRLTSMVNIFESAVLREFEQGYEFWDVDGRMRRYAHVLHMLNGSLAGIELFIQKHPIFDDRDLMANPIDCFNQAAEEDISPQPSHRFFETLLTKVNGQTEVLERIFPEASTVFWNLVDRTKEDIITDYTTTLFDEAHDRNSALYVKAVSGLFEQCLLFFRSLVPPKGSNENTEAKAKELALSVFEPHLDLYLQEELEHLTKHAESEVSKWEKKLSDQDSSLESYWMSNINRSADKSDFLSSFKKVVMMPVTVLPSFPIGSPFAQTKSSTAPTNNAPASRSATPKPETLSVAVHDGRKSPLPENAPNDELAAKAALMTSKLEGIKALFSIEVALNLVHAAQASLGRVAVFIRLGGQAGGEAKEQCANIFIVLLRILGDRHVRSGFDKAVAHLSNYNPREVSDHSGAGVTPLVQFIELVNVGDLISQMIDVFYEQQLSAPKIADKNDFLDPAGLAKKRFEQMLDERVAAGLNKGIDVLMDEVEYLHGTMQQPTDYNPPPSTGADIAELDIGPTPTAKRIVELVSSHTRMLIGTTEKTMLDVFNGEVGLRLFTAICKHLKRQRISTEGAIKLIADMNLHSDYIRTLRNPDLQAYFGALRELSQIYLIDAAHAKEMATVIADGDRFGGIFRAEEVYEYAQRRADWYQVRKSVERAMYGMECCVM